MWLSNLRFVPLRLLIATRTVTGFGPRNDWGPHLKRPKLPPQRVYLPSMGISQLRRIGSFGEAKVPGGRVDLGNEPSSVEASERGMYGIHQSGVSPLRVSSVQQRDGATTMVYALIIVVVLVIVIIIAGMLYNPASSRDNSSGDLPGEGGDDGSSSGNGGGNGGNGSA